MSVSSIAHQFVDLCSQGKNFDVMRTMYAPDIISVEGDGKETAGQQPVIHKSEIWQGNNQIHGEKVRGPFFNGPNQFAVHFSFDITRKAEHQAFGAGGRHFCLGTALARLELKVLMEETLKRYPQIEPAGEPAAVESLFLNQLKRLPVRLTPPASGV